jgi:polyisoprenoid-binding protein YceI
MFKNLVLTALLGVLLVGLAPETAPAAEWTVDPAHSVLTFKIRHLFSRTDGRFNEWSGTLDFDPARITEGSARITIQAASIDTDNDDRDNHLRSSDFFDVEKNPTITFVSTKIEESDGGYLLHGDLTMAGVTKPVTIPFQFLGVGPDPWGKTRAGFSGELTVNRKDFGIVWNKALDQGGVMLGDDVQIDLEIEVVEEAS